MTDYLGIPSLIQDDTPRYAVGTERIELGTSSGTIRYLVASSLGWSAWEDLLGGCHTIKNQLFSGQDTFEAVCARGLVLWFSSVPIGIEV